MEMMDIAKAESRFLSLLELLSQPENQYIKEFQSYRFVKKILANKSMMLKYIDLKTSDIRYVKKFIKGKTLIDAGCGSGSFSILLSLLGAKKVFAVDYVADSVEMTRAFANIANIKNITAIHSDIGKLDLPNDSIDGIFSIEAISHYQNCNSFFSMASKVLKDNGFLFIRDGNNKLSRYIRKRNYRIWDVFENYRDPITLFGYEKKGACYLDMRKKIIKDEFPDLSEEALEKFAKYTFAYCKERIIMAVSSFIKGDFSLKSEYTYGKCPLNPETDCYMEYLFDPIYLKRKLRHFGFRSKVISRGPANRNLRLLRYFWELFSPVTIFLLGGFQIIAIKTSG